MTEFARIVDDKIVEVRNFAMPPDPNPAKGLDWRPLTREAQPTFDRTTQVVNEVDSVLADGAIRQRVVRDKTADELANEEIAKQASIKAQLAEEPLASLVRRIEALEAAQRSR